MCKNAKVLHVNQEKISSNDFSVHIMIIISYIFTSLAVMNFSINLILVFIVRFSLFYFKNSIFLVADK